MNSQLFRSLGICCMLIFSVVANAQSRSITGTVVDQKSQPVIGAVIKEKGTGNAAIAGIDGTFSITIASASPTLVVSFVGMENKEVVVGASNSIYITLSASDESLNEVVVTAQNIKRNSRSLGYSVASVNSVDIVEGGTRSAVNGLQGKIAGVQISAASSDPGASTRIFIRGIHSLSQGTQPLIVVDGVPISNASTNSSSLNGGFDFGNGLNTINPNDIASMDVLKSAAATALYGSRGANGVIMITTKSGSGASAKKGLGIEYNGSATFSNVLRLPEFQNEFGQGWDGNHWLDENGSWGPKFDGRDRVYGRVVDNAQLLAPYSPLENNVKEFFERGKSINNSIGVSGANETSSFYASYSNVKQDGIYPGQVDINDRNTITLKAQTKIDKLTVSGGVNIAMTDGTFVPTGQGQSGTYNNTMQLPRNMSVVDMQDYNAPFYNVEDYFTGYGVTNPYFILNENGNSYKGRKVYGNLQTSYDIKDNLKVLYRFGYDINDNNIHNHRAILLPQGPNGGSIDDPGFVSEQSSGSQEFNNDVMLTWNKKINSLIKLDLTGGMNINGRSNNSLFASVSALDIPGFYNIQNSPSQPVISESNASRRQVNFYGLANLDYKNTAFLNVSLRRDQSSTLPSESNAYYYPSANVSYVLSEGLNLPKAISFAKVRFGYGVTANDAPSYAFDRYYSQSVIDMPFRSMNFPVGGVNSFSINSNLANPDLKVEYNREWEFGLDLKALDNRASLDLTLYSRVTDDMILFKAVAPSAGGTNQISNFADILNKGVEIVASYKVLRKEDGLNWDIFGNFSKNLNEVRGLSEDFNLGGLSTTSFTARNGQPIGVFEGSVPETSPSGQVVVDADGVPVASTQKEEYGNSQIGYMLGIGSKLKYKAFRLNFLFDARQGGLMFSRTADINHFTGNSIKTAYNDRKPFVVPNSVRKIDQGDGTFTYEENTIAVDPAHMDDYHRAEAFDRNNVISKSFVKLRELALTYTIPASSIEKMPFSGMSFSIIGRNLLLWTPVENQYVDPEATTFGNGINAEFGEFSANPTTRSYGFALRFTL
tara:strand:- start:3361 stop:6513 length:3153 start_codon:yes stop_codon:yes gene_type:complete